MAKARKPRASRAKTPAGKKRALIRAKTREAKERFQLEKLEKERRKEIREAKARGERAPSRRKSPVAQAVALTRRAVRWVTDQVKALATAILGDPNQEFYEFTHGPVARDHIRRLHTGREPLRTYEGERYSGKIEEYVNHDTLPWILSLIDVGAEHLVGQDIWNITLFLFSDAKETIGSPSPMEDVGRFQASYDAGGIGESYREARENLETKLRQLIAKTVHLYALYFVVFTRSLVAKKGH